MLPLVRRLGSEDPERRSRDEMASKVEGVVYGSVHAEEALGGSSRDMLIARDGEELVCPKGTICGRMACDANDQITDGDFAMLETCVSPDGQRYVCACCERAVAVREHFRWRVHLRRGWIR
jgi:hypothetical protein